MKKIIKSSTLFLGACFFAGALHAQLTSDKPAMTAQQMTDLIQKGKADASKAATTSSNTVSVSSDKPAMTNQQTVQLMQRGKTEVKIEPAKTQAVQQPSTTSSLPALSAQGGVKPVTSEPATETKVQQPPMQSEKPVPVKQQ